MTADHLTWYSLGRVASFTGSGRCGRSGRILHSNSVTWVHLIVLIISQTRFIHHVSSSTIVWNVVKRLTIWSYVLHLSDGLGGRGHLQHEHFQWPGAGGSMCTWELCWWIKLTYISHHMLLLSPGHQCLTLVSTISAQLTGVGRHSSTVTICHHLILTSTWAGALTLHWLIISSPETWKNIQTWVCREIFTFRRVANW